MLVGNTIVSWTAQATTATDPDAALGHPGRPRVVVRHGPGPCTAGGPRARLRPCRPSPRLDGCMVSTRSPAASSSRSTSTWWTGTCATWRLSGDFFLEPDEGARGPVGLARGSAGRHGAAPCWRRASRRRRNGSRDPSRWWASTPARWPRRCGAHSAVSTVWSDHTFELIHTGPASAGAARGARPGADRGARRRTPRTDAAVLGMGRAGGDHRVVPVAAQRGRPRRRGRVRHHGRPPDLRWRGDVHGGRQLHHVLDGRAGLARRRHDVRGVVRLPQPVGARRARGRRRAGVSCPASTTSPRRSGSSPAPRRSASSAVRSCTT